jgi:hypothetical protein
MCAGSPIASVPVRADIGRARPRCLGEAWMRERRRFAIAGSLRGRRRAHRHRAHPRDGRDRRARLLTGSGATGVAASVPRGPVRPLWTSPAPRSGHAAGRSGSVPPRSHERGIRPTRCATPSGCGRPRTGGRGGPGVKGRWPARRPCWPPTTPNSRARCSSCGTTPSRDRRWRRPGAVALLGRLAIATGWWQAIFRCQLGQPVRRRASSTSRRARAASRPVGRFEGATRPGVCLHQPRFGPIAEGTRPVTMPTGRPRLHSRFQ